MSVLMLSHYILLPFHVFFKNVLHIVTHYFDTFRWFFLRLKATYYDIEKKLYMKKPEIHIINTLKCKGYLKFMKRCMWKKPQYIIKISSHIWKTNIMILNLLYMSAAWFNQNFLSPKLNVKAVSHDGSRVYYG